MLANEEKVFFKTSDRLKLCGILSTPKQKTDKCIILCHGITVDKEEGGIYSELICKLCDVGFTVFRFDFRGHGESEGKNVDMTVIGETKDLEAAISFLNAKDFAKFGVVAASFAGGAVSFFASNHQNIIKALVLWNSVIDYSEMINPTLPWTTKYWGKPAFERVDKFGFTEIGSKKFKAGLKLMEEIKTLKPWESLLKLLIPTLFIHGDKDQYVRIEDSIRYSQMMKNAKLEVIKGADHGFHENQKYADEADKATIEFFQRYL